MPALPNDLVTLGYVAEAAGVHVRTIRRRVADGSLPAYRFGPRLLRVSRSDAEKLFRTLPTAGGVR